MSKTKNLQLDSFLSYLKIERGCSSNTIKGYSHDLTSLKAYLEEQNIFREFEWGNFRIMHLRGFLSHLYNEKNNKTSSIHRRVCSIKAFYRYLMDNEEIETDPAKDLKYPKRPSSIPKFLQAEHIKTLFESANNPTHRVIMEVLYSTGARCNELRKMDIDDVNTADRSITIRSGKGNKDRVVLLSERAATLLEKYLTTTRIEMMRKAEAKGSVSQDTRQAVFLSNRGKRIANRTIQHFISQLSKDIGVKHTTPHMLRHSFASHLVMSNTSIRVVQKLLGHASLDTTQIYANVTPEFMKKEFDNSLPLR